MWPAGGLNRRMAHRDQAPYTTPDALNVRTRDVIEGRARGGQRPGLSKAYSTQLGSGNPIRLLSQMTTHNTSSVKYFVDNFNGDSLSSQWSDASWLAAGIAVESNELNMTGGTVEAGSVLDAISDIDTSSDYAVDVQILPYAGAHHGTYKVFLRMDNSTPDATDEGVIVTFSITGATGVYSGTIVSYSGGTPTSTALTGGTTGNANPGVLSVAVSGTGITVKWNGTSIGSATAASHSGARMGLGLEATVDGGAVIVDWFRVRYVATGNYQSLRTFLCASSNGLFYTETAPGQIAALSTSTTLNSAYHLQAAEDLQKLYIADYGDPKVLVTNATVASDGVTLDSASVADWTAVGINALDYVAVILTSAGDTVAGTYRISSVASGDVTLATSTGGAGTGLSVRIERGVKVYDPSAGTLATLVETAGKPPAGCRVIARYRDRIVLAGNLVEPHNWFMSAQGDATDWNYSATASTGAVAGNNSEAGQIGEPVRALCPYRDDYLIMGGARSLWVMRGDPKFGGELDNLSRNVGIVAPQAWCWTPEGALVFLSYDGLYMLPPGALGAPIQVSADVLPDELRKIDENMYTITMAYDVDAEGIHLYLTGAVSGNIWHWFFDWDVKAFWPVKIPGTMEPTALIAYNGWSSNTSGVLLGGRDGYIRWFRDDAETDDGTEIASHVVFGPFRPGGSDFKDGVLTQMRSTVAANGGSVTWSILKSDRAENIVDGGTAMATGTWATGHNRRTASRVRAASMAIKLSAVAGSLRTWAMEKLSITLDWKGRQR